MLGCGGLIERAMEDLRASSNPLRDVLEQVLRRGFVVVSDVLYALTYYDSQWFRHRVEAESVEIKTVYSYGDNPFCELWVDAIRPSGAYPRVVYYMSPRLVTVDTPRVYEVWEYQGGWHGHLRRKGFTPVSILDVLYQRWY